MRDEDNTKLSRSEKYKDLYNEEYSNVTVDFDLSNLIDDEYTETMEFDNDIIETIAYKEKDYDINNFLKEMKKEAKEDSLPRSLSENIEMMNNEINNIIETMNKEIEESNDDFFGDLMPDDENTIVTDSNEESNTNGVGGIVSDTVINNFLMNKDLTDTHSFIDDTDSVEKVEEKEKDNELYFKNYFNTHGRRIRKTNLYCYYHGYFILYSFGNREFVEQFTNDLATALFKIAEEKQVHVFVQPYFGIAQVSDPKENIFTSIDNALGARNYAEKTFQEKVYFDESVVNTATEDDIKEIEKAIDDEEFVIYYQPKVSLKTNEVVGSEALIRWNSSKYGFCGPDKFLSKAEEGGLMHDIDMYVFEKVCEDLSETKRKGRKMIPVSVNFSLYEFYAPNFLSDLTRILHSFDLDPGLIEIEITEGTSQANSFLAISYLKKIKEKGMKILMDDFGTGYSNLGNLNKLPIDKVKIDKSLIDNIVDNERTRESVRYLINLCIANGMESIAEGVDNAKQVEVLRRLHCDAIQGYYFSRPIPKDEYEKFIAEHRVDKKKTKGGNE